MSVVGAALFLMECVVVGYLLAGSMMASSWFGTGAFLAATALGVIFAGDIWMTESESS